MLGNAVTAGQPYPAGVDPSVQLPAGALPPPTPPRVKLTLAQWWYVNKWVIAAIIVFFGVIPGLWAASSVPVISTTHDFTVSIVPRAPTPISGAPPSAPIYQGLGFFGESEGGTLSGTFWAANGTGLHLSLEFGSAVYSSNNSSGSFHLLAGERGAMPFVLFFSYSNSTLYLNGTQSFLVPLLG